MEVDTLYYATEGILSIECEDGRWRSVAFLSKISKWDREKLLNSWQRDIGGDKRIGKLETSIRRHKVQVWGLDWP